MVQVAAEKGWIEADAAMKEMLLSIRRAGTAVIPTYFARPAFEFLTAAPSE